MEKDLTKKRGLSDNCRYADLINGLVFQGKQLVREQDLSDMDSQTGMWGSLPAGGKHRHKQRYRDLVRKVAFGVNFAVVGIENQEEVNYLMPLRNMAYDAAEYERQAAAIGKSVHMRSDITAAEFLSGFAKADKLHPCITLVLFFGEKWEGSRDLYGILDLAGIPKELRAYINNYPIHVFEVRSLENTEVFQTDLKQIFDFIRYSKDKEKLRKLVQNDPAYQNMAEDAYDMVVEYTHAEEMISVKKYYGKDGKVNMCEALTALIEDGRQEGISQGIEQGIKALIETCQDLGLTQGDTSSKVQEKFSLSMEKIQEYIGKYWR